MTRNILSVLVGLLLIPIVLGAVYGAGCLVELIHGGPIKDWPVAAVGLVSGLALVVLCQLGFILYQFGECVIEMIETWRR